MQSHMNGFVLSHSRFNIQFIAIRQLHLFLSVETLSQYLPKLDMAIYCLLTISRLFLSFQLPRVSFVYVLYIVYKLLQCSETPGGVMFANI